MWYLLLLYYISVIVYVVFFIVVKSIKCVTRYLRKLKTQVKCVKCVSLLSIMGEEKYVKKLMFSYFYFFMKFCFAHWQNLQSKSPISVLVERYLKILDDMTMVRIYVKTSTSTNECCKSSGEGWRVWYKFPYFQKERGGGGIIGGQIRWDIGHFEIKLPGRPSLLGTTDKFVW